MNNGWMALQSIPHGGTTLTLDDHPLWRAHLEEFTPCRTTTPLQAQVTILPQEDGVLFQGTLSADVIMPCIRCAEDTPLHIAEHFDAFEPFPEDPLAVATANRAAAKRNKPAEPQDPEETPDAPDEAVIRIAPLGKGAIEINPAALVWEEFSLALPVAPLCNKSCKGLCPVCGVNKNTETCACVTDEGDPRLAALRKLKLSGS